jgi:hypothetical protein
MTTKPLADFVGYRWKFKSGEPFRCFATIEIGPAAILELAGYSLEERRASGRRALDQTSNNAM